MDIDQETRRYPYCVVWTPIPFIRCYRYHATSYSSCRNIAYNVQNTRNLIMIFLIIIILNCVALVGGLPYWLFPLIGHMGITTSSGVIRDFSGSFYVAEDDMAFGNPTKYWQLDITSIHGGSKVWDKSINDASIEYFNRMHNLLCDNCHSHVGMALSLMNYNNSKNWNMVKLALYTFVFGKYTSWNAWFKTWGPFIICVIVCATFYSYSKYL